MSRHNGKKIYMLDYNGVTSDIEAEDIVDALYQFINMGLVKDDDKWDAMRHIRRDYGE
jgi:hypothetical protein